MKEKTVFIAVYGTLRTGERNHHYTANALSNRPCTLKGTLYDTGYGFPAFVPQGDSMVVVELIEVTLADWAAIDRLEGYPLWEYSHNGYYENYFVMGILMQ